MNSIKRLKIVYLSKKQMGCCSNKELQMGRLNMNM